MDAYEKKVARAIRLLQSIPQDGDIYYCNGKRVTMNRNG